MTAITVSGARAAARLHVSSLGRALPYVALGLLLTAVMRRAWTSPNELTVGGDVLLIHYPLFVLLREVLASGALPWWNPYTFSGLPAFADPHAGYLYPPELLLAWLPPIAAINWTVGLHVVLAGLTMTWLARRLGAPVEGQLLSGAAFALGSAMTARLHAGHLSFLEGNAWLPLATALAIDATRRRAVVVLALVVAVMALAGQPELLIFSVWWLPLWAGGAAVARTTPPLALRRFGPGVARAVGGAWLGLGLGLALAAVQLLPTFVFAETASRAGGMSWSFQTTSSLPPWHLLGAFGPGVFGDPARPYWPGPSYEWHERLFYIGIVPLLAAAWVPPRWRWLCWGSAALAVLLAFGRYAPVYAWAQLLPGYPSFRVPSKHLLLAALALALAAGLGLERMRGRPAALTAAVLAGLLGLASVTFGAWFPVVAPWLGGPDALAGAPERGALAALAAPSLRVAALLALIAAPAALLPGVWARRALLLLALLDLVVVLQPFRLTSVDPNDLAAQAAVLQPNPRVAVVGSGGSDLANYGPVVHVVQPAGYTSLFGGPYATLLTGNVDQQAAIDVDRADNPALSVLGYPLTFDLGNKQLRPNASATPTAWVAHCAWPGGALEARAPAFPRQQCVTLADVTQPQAALAPGAANVVGEGDSWRTIEADGPGWLVVTLPWYPGWTARLDGADQPVDVLDGALVGVALPSGSHTVDLRYRPAGLLPGLALSVLAALSLAGVWLAPRRIRRALGLRHPAPATSPGTCTTGPGTGG